MRYVHPFFTDYAFDDSIDSIICLNSVSKQLYRILDKDKDTMDLMKIISQRITRIYKNYPLNVFVYEAKTGNITSHVDSGFTILGEIENSNLITLDPSDTILFSSSNLSFDLVFVLQKNHIYSLSERRFVFTNLKFNDKIPELSIPKIDFIIDCLNSSSKDSIFIDDNTPFKITAFPKLTLFNSGSINYNGKVFPLHLKLKTNSLGLLPSSTHEKSHKLTKENTPNSTHEKSHSITIEKGEGVFIRFKEDPNYLYETIGDRVFYIISRRYLKRKRAPPKSSNFELLIIHPKDPLLFLNREGNVFSVRYNNYIHPNGNDNFRFYSSSQNKYIFVNKDTLINEFLSS